MTQLEPHYSADPITPLNGVRRSFTEWLGLGLITQPLVGFRHSFARVRCGPHHPAFSFESDLPLPFQGVALLGPHHPANPTKLALKWRTLRGLRVLVESHSPWVSLG